MTGASSFERSAAGAGNDPLGALLDHDLPYGVLLVREDGLVAYANDAATALLSQPDATVAGGTLHELFRGAVQPDGAPLPWRRHPVAVAWRSGEGVHDTTIGLPLPDGSMRWLLCDALPLTQGETGFSYVLATFVDISARMRDEQAQRLRSGYLGALQDMTTALVRRLDPAELLEVLVTVAAAVLGSKNGALLLAQTGGEALVVAAGTGTHAASVSRRFRRNEGLVGRVWASGEPQVVNDYQAWEYRVPGLHTLSASIAVPVVVEGEALGVISVSHTVPGRVFSPDDLTVLAQFARLAAMAVAGIRHRQARAAAGE